MRRWTKTALLRKGTNHVAATIPQPNDYSISVRWGKVVRFEVFMRHRSPLMYVDLSSVPAGSSILAACLVVVMAADKVLDDHDPSKKPTMWVVEPCNRPWEEYEVNAFEYPRGASDWTWPVQCPSRHRAGKRHVLQDRAVARSPLDAR
jgi:hypothetical protein